MRLRVSGNGGHLVRFAALIAAGTFLAGCSSGVSRFQDGIFTGSTANQRAIIGAPAHQPYPGDVNRGATPVDAVYTGSVNRAAVTPVSVDNQPMQRAELPPVAASPEPVRVAAIEPAPAAPARVEQSATRGAPPSVLGTLPARSDPAVAEVPAPAAVPPRVAAASGGDAQEGWSRTGGTQVTVKSGETVYNLSRRFGVPADAILKANNMGSANQLAAGQQIVIPTYVYSRRAPVSAPDANPNGADARSSTGTRHDVPADRVPVPAPAQRVAILPNAPKPKEARTEETQAAAAPAPTAPAAPAVEPLPQPAVVKNPPAGGGYTVVAGDSLYAIAKKTGTTTAQLKAANGLSDGVLRIGQKLVIPAAGQVAVASAPAAKPAGDVDTVTTGTARPKAAPQAEPSPVTAYTPPRVAEKVIAEAEQSAAVAPGATGVARMRWPARGRIIASYGRSGGRSNDGIDIAVPEGTSVKAAENGVVIYAGDGLKEFGNTVLVRHEDGLVTVYGHASELKVSRGEKVRRGQEIARSGMSGSADVPKLHFEVRKDSSPVDPMLFLE